MSDKENYDLASAKVFAPVSEDRLTAADASSLLYARGYYLTDKGVPELGSHWMSAPLGSFTLGWDSRNPVCITSGNGYQIAVVGRCYDLGLSTGDAQAIGRNLLQALAVGMTAFNQAVYNLAGRFVLVARTPSGIFLETDATGMKAGYYSTGGGVVASHSRLAASLAGTTDPSPFGGGGWFGRTKAFSYPGRCTEYAAVRILTPNTRLSVESGNIERVYPLKEAVSLRADEAAAQILPLMREQLRWLTSIGQPQISLTAGLDSRVTLAASRPYHEACLYFSYATAKGNSIQTTREDLEFASRIAADKGLLHQQVEAPEEIPVEIEAIMADNSKRVHARSVAYAYRNQLPTDAIHIRSNIYEIGRAYYQYGSRRELPQLTTTRMAELLAKKGGPPADSVVAAFDDWAGTTLFDSIPAGYDAYDLYYWEIRMGSWMQAVLLESDIAHDTYTLVNSRRILDLFLAVNLPHRISGSTMYHIIHAAWPELLELPVNGRIAAASKFD